MDFHSKPTAHEDDTSGTDKHQETGTWFRSSRTVHKQFCISLHASRRLNKHHTLAPPSYLPLVLSPPHERIPGDPRVHKPTIRETRMTRVVNGVRHTPLRDTLFRRNG